MDNIKGLNCFSLYAMHEVCASLLLGCKPNWSPHGRGKGYCQLPHTFILKLQLGLHQNLLNKYYLTFKPA